MFELGLPRLQLHIMAREYQHVLNVDNIATMFFWQTRRILRHETPRDRTAFVQFLFRRWIASLANDFTMSTMRHVQWAAWKLRIALTEADMHELEIFEERVFSRQRHIKVLEISTPLRSRERVGVKYLHAQLYASSDNRLTFVAEGAFMMSNLRLLLQTDGPTAETHSFEWSKISWYRYATYGFEFKFSDALYVFRIHDQVTLNNTIANMISKKVKNAIKKRQDY